TTQPIVTSGIVSQLSRHAVDPPADFVCFPTGGGCGDHQKFLLKRAGRRGLPTRETSASPTDKISVPQHSLSLARLQASRLLPVVQPFVKNDALFVIEKSFFKRCLLLGSICICRWLSLFQNSNEPVLTRRGKIADLAGVKECHGIFNVRKIGRF